MKQVTPQELLQLQHENADVTLIDVRTPAEFGEVHLDAAKNVPLDKLNVKAIAQELDLNPDSRIVLICKSGSRGKMGCEKFIKSGFENVANVEGGTDGCLNLDFDVTRGQKVMSLERQVRIAAGLLVLMGVVLGFAVHPGFFGLSGFIGAGLVFAGITDTCGMGILISKMPWNQVKNVSSCPTPKEANA